MWIAIFIGLLFPSRAWLLPAMQNFFHRSLAGHGPSSSLHWRNSGAGNGRERVHICWSWGSYVHSGGRQMFSFTVRSSASIPLCGWLNPSDVVAKHVTLRYSKLTTLVHADGTHYTSRCQVPDTDLTRSQNFVCYLMDKNERSNCACVCDSLRKQNVDYPRASEHINGHSGKHGMTS